MSCSLKFPLSHSHDGGIAQLGSSQAGASGGPVHRSRSCQGLSGLNLIYFYPRFCLFMIISHSCTYDLALDLVHWYVVFTHSCVCLGPGPLCFHALSYMLNSFFPPAFAQLSESTCCFCHFPQKLMLVTTGSLRRTKKKRRFSCRVKVVFHIKMQRKKMFMERLQTELNWSFIQKTKQNLK